MIHHPCQPKIIRPPSVWIWTWASLVDSILVWRPTYVSVFDSRRKRTNPLSPDRMDFLIAASHTSPYHRSKCIHFLIWGAISSVVCFDQDSKRHVLNKYTNVRIKSPISVKSETLKCNQYLLLFLYRLAEKSPYLYLTTWICVCISCAVVQYKGPHSELCKEVRWHLGHSLYIIPCPFFFYSLLHSLFCLLPSPLCRAFLFVSVS